jgi:hypothetical protein
MGQAALSRAAVSISHHAGLKGARGWGVQQEKGGSKGRGFKRKLRYRGEGKFQVRKRG